MVEHIYNMYTHPVCTRPFRQEGWASLASSIFWLVRRASVLRVQCESLFKTITQLTLLFQKMFQESHSSTVAPRPPPLPAAPQHPHQLMVNATGPVTRVENPTAFAFMLCYTRLGSWLAPTPEQLRLTSPQGRPRHSTLARGHSWLRSGPQALQQAWRGDLDALKADRRRDGARGHD